MRSKNLFIGLMIMALFFGVLAACGDGGEMQTVAEKNVSLTMFAGEKLNYSELKGETSFSSDDDGIAYVSKTGMVYGVSEGTAEVRAVSGNKAVKYSVTVSAHGGNYDFYNVDGYYDFRSSDNKVPLQLYNNNTTLEITLGHDPISADYTPLVMYDSVKRLPVSVTRPEWLILWADAENGKYFAVDTNSSGGTCAVFDFKSKYTFIAYEDSYISRTVAGYAKFKSRSPFVVEYDEAGQSYKVYKKDGAAEIFSLDFSTLKKDFNQIASFTPRIGFIASNSYNTTLKLGDEPFVAEGGNDKYLGKSWLCIGDSVTAGGSSYLFEVQKKLGMSCAVNAGISGALLTDGLAAVANSVVFRIKNDKVEYDYDLITVFIGSNDFNMAAPYGEKNSTNTREYYGAMKYTIETLREKAPNAEIVFMTMLDRSVPPNTNNGQTTKAYHDITIEVSEDRGIKCMDMFESGINLTNVGQYTTDGLHPNFGGQKVLADYVAAQLLK